MTFFRIIFVLTTLTVLSCSEVRVGMPEDKVDGMQQTDTPGFYTITNDYRHNAGYARIKAEHSIIYMPSGTWSYTHHPSVTWFRGRFHVVYSNGRKGEDEPGQRIMYSSSSDFKNWTLPVVIDEPGMGDYGYEKVLSPGGIGVYEDKLVVYITENDTDGITNKRLSPKLYARYSEDGQVWSGRVDTGLRIFPSQRPFLTSGGKLLMTCNNRIYITDDKGGLSGWKGCKTELPDSEAALPKPAICEGTIYEIDSTDSCNNLVDVDNRNDLAVNPLICLFRATGDTFDGYLWQSQSNDGGQTWSYPRKSGFTDNGSKTCVVKAAGGRYLYVGVPDNTNVGARHPLMILFSHDGLGFSRNFILSDDHYKMLYPGRWKTGDYGYPFLFIQKDWAYIVVSRRKERLDAYKFNISQIL